MRMLSRFEGRDVRITLEDGEVLTGTGEALPSGYGLHEFGRGEESLQIGDRIIFRSDIRNIEILPLRAPIPRRGCDDLVGDLLQRPCWIVDVLPERVPDDAGGQYFAVERYWLQPGQNAALRRKYARILLALNCYFDMAVSFDGGERWERNPDPEALADDMAGPGVSGDDFLRAVFEAQGAMIDFAFAGTRMEVFDPALALLDKVRALAGAEGLFVWEEPEP